MSRIVKVDCPIHIELLISARKALVAIRDDLLVTSETQRTIDKMVGEIEGLLGY